jgi:putative membrane protein
MATALLVDLQASWQPGGHAAGGVWLDFIGRWAPWVVLGVLVFFVARALWRQNRYRAVAVLGEAEQQRVHAALGAAEKRTVGEIVPVVLERSDRHPAAEWSAALAFLLVGTGVLAVQLPWNRPAYVLLAQLALGAIGFGLARWLPDFKRHFMSGARAGEMAEEQAFQEFYRLGLQRTEQATGVLILVSLLEHRVVVLGDQGIAERVEPQLWSEVDGIILRHIGAGDLGGGLVAGIEACGEVLAQHFPWAEGDRNEIPDRLIVRRE